MTIKIGVMRDGKIVAAEGLYKYQAGAFPGSPVMNGCMCGFAPYDIPNQRTLGYDVVCNRPKTVAYRAPGLADLGVCRRKHARRVREKNRHGSDTAAYQEHRQAGNTAGVRRKDRPHRLRRDAAGAFTKHPAWTKPLGKNQGRGMACGYWFNGGGESSATVHVNEDGTAVVATGSPDIGGSRASTAQMAAETLGIRLRERAADHRRHQFGRLYAGDRRLARHLRDRPRRDRRVQEGDRRNVRARREDLEDRRRGRDLGGRRRAACRRARRRVSADVVQGNRRPSARRPAARSSLHPR